MGTQLHSSLQVRTLSSTQNMARLAVTLLVLAMIALSFAQDSSDTVNKEATKLEERGFYGGYGGYGGYGYYRRPYYGLYGGYGGYYRRPYYGGYGFYRSGEEPKEGADEAVKPAQS